MPNCSAWGSTDPRAIRAWGTGHSWEGAGEGKKGKKPGQPATGLSSSLHSSKYLRG